MPTTSTAARTIPQDLLDGIRNNDDAAIERGFRAVFPSLLAEATPLAENPASAGPIVGKAFLKAISSPQNTISADTLNAALSAAIHESAARDKSRRAAVHRFEHNEGVATTHAAAPLTNATVSADEVWGRVKQAREALKHPSKGPAADGHLAASHMTGAMDRKNKWAIPIAIFAIAVVALGVYAVSKVENKPRESDITSALRSADGETLVSGDGQVGHITLKDETAVTLAYDSKLRVPKKLDTWRAIGINGAASFVVPAGSRPFELRGNRFGVTLPSGTVDVAADSAAPTTVVRIRAGSGTMHVGDSSWVAPAGKAYVIENGPKIREATIEDVTDAFSWINGRFSAKGKVGDLVVKLSHAYGQEVGIGDKSITDREGVATGSLDSMKATVASLEKSAKLKASGVDGKWVLFPAGKK
jgi:ferric-dicitrate binding protein FerR (iron transport regulator)